VPPCLWYDGIASCAGPYSADELREPVSDLQDDAYRWEIGRYRRWWWPNRASFLVGCPVAPE